MQDEYRSVFPAFSEQPLAACLRHICKRVLEKTVFEGYSHLTIVHADTLDLPSMIPLSKNYFS